MNENQQAAYIMAQAACLAAEVAGMQAENAVRIQDGEPIKYHENAFADVLNSSQCRHNDVIGFFRS